MNVTDTIWQSEGVAEHYLDGVRGALPLADVQVDVMLRVIAAALPEGVDNFLDLGCGDGILGDQILWRYPQASGIFVDFSPAMLEAARERLAPHDGHIGFVELDFGRKDWRMHPDLRACWPFDLVISGFAIHHQPDDRKWELYNEIYSMIRPGGLFLNLEHVSSRTPFVEELFGEQMVDALYAYQRKIDSGKTRDEVADEFYNREDQDANILCDVETQCHWLREIGFKDVDCYLKIFEFALFGGRKP